MKSLDPALVVLAFVAGVLAVALATVAIRPPRADVRVTCEVRP